MIRFIHSADWQLGARFSQFGAKGTVLREARLSALKRSLDIARQRNVDAYIVAGDLFEDNQVGDDLVSTVAQMFSDYPTVPIFLLPGNHDPYAGPDSLWMRRPFAKIPSHIQIIDKAKAIDLGGAFLLASPLHQKMSTLDPSLKLCDLAAGLPADAIKIGVTHGALAIEGKHQANDFPIALNAASRAGLDYLAVGHWHNWLVDTDGGRIVMPGTPEPDSFDHQRCGYVAYVEIEGQSAAPRIEAVPVAELSWHELTFDLLSADASRATLSQTLSNQAPQAAKSVVRVVLTGAASVAQITETHQWLDDLLKPFFIGQVSDKSSIALSAVELQDLQARHPILAQVLADIDQIDLYATSRAPTSANSGLTPLTLTEAQDLLSPRKITLSALTPEQLTQTRQLLLQVMQDASS